MKPGFLRAGLVDGSLPEGHQEAVLSGYQLYDSGMDYPCLVKSASATDIVQGFLFKYTSERIQKALELFDVIEGTNDPEPLFIRHQTVALATKDNDQKAISCWVYLYAQAVEDLKLIKDGNWVKEKGRKK